MWLWQLPHSPQLILAHPLSASKLAKLSTANEQPHQGSHKKYSVRKTNATKHTSTKSNLSIAVTVSGEIIIFATGFKKKLEGFIDNKHASWPH